MTSLSAGHGSRGSYHEIWGQLPVVRSQSRICAAGLGSSPQVWLHVGGESAALLPDQGAHRLTWGHTARRNTSRSRRTR